MYETRPQGLQYKQVPASSTGLVLGVTGRTGGILHKIIVIPATTSPGAVTILDGATSIPIFPGGATSVVDLKPFILEVDMLAAGKWSVTTGLNVSVIAVGWFD